MLTFQEQDRRNEEAFCTPEALQKGMAGENSSETLMEGLDEKEKKAITARCAVVLFRLGRVRETEKFYMQFLFACLADCLVDKIRNCFFPLGDFIVAYADKAGKGHAVDLTRWHAPPDCWRQATGLRNILISNLYRWICKS